MAQILEMDKASSNNTWPRQEINVHHTVAGRIQGSFRGGRSLA